MLSLHCLRHLFKDLLYVQEGGHLFIIKELYGKISSGYEDLSDSQYQIPK